MPPKTFRKRVRKFVRSGARTLGKAIKNRYTSKRGLRFNNIAKDVMMLKSMVNAEKKRIITTVSNVPLGQLRGIDAGGGYYAADVTPIPAQGLTNSTRNGSSIKLSSSFYQFQITQQSSNISPISGIMEFFLVKGDPALPLDMVTARYLPNSFASPQNLYDKSSMLNPDNFALVSCIRRVPFYIPGDQQGSQLYFKTFGVGIKYNKGNGHHIRYNANTTNVTQGQIILVIRCDSGNCSTITTATHTNVPQTATATGLLLNYTQTHYYYDN